DTSKGVDGVNTGRLQFRRPGRRYAMWKEFDQALNAVLCARANSPCVLSSHTVPIANIDDAA
ncbi:MAG TPA: hypothetical protein VI029_10255, partial [Mycobacterium sp.]